MADLYTLNSTLAPQSPEFVFSEKQTIFVPDSNNGSFPSGVVSFDLTSLANQSKWLDLQQSFISIPLVMQLKASAGAFSTANVENAFAMSLKNHVFQLLHSMSLEIGNNSVVNLTNFANIDINYKILNSFSHDDVKNFGPSILFGGLDTPESVNYQGADDPAGLGECNNTIKETTFTSAGGYGTTSMTQNKGRLERMKYTSFNPAATEIANFKSAQQCNVSGKNYCTISTSAITYYVTANLPCKFLHDIFQKLPLTKGMYMRLILNLNTQAQIVLTTNGTNYQGRVSVNSPHNVIPFQLSPIASGDGFVSTGATQLTADIGIGKSYDGTVSHPSGNSCRFYATVYEASPAYEERILQTLPVKQVHYDDILSFEIKGVNSGESVSRILSNGISRARYMIIHPLLSASLNGSATIAGQTTFAAGHVMNSPMNSPFSAAPGTCLPYGGGAVSSFNVLVSGSNLYQANIDYGWQEFLTEVRGSKGLNGGLSTGLSSGLIGQSEWENGYGFVYVDLSRKVSTASDDVSRSYQVLFQNNSNVQCDYIIIIGYEREIGISLANGSLVV